MGERGKWRSWGHLRILPTTHPMNNGTDNTMLIERNEEHQGMDGCQGSRFC